MTRPDIRIVSIAALALLLSSCRTAPEPTTLLKGKYAVTSTGQRDAATEATEPLSPDELLAAGGTAGDVFAGTDRRAAKTSIADAGVETFTTIRALRQTLESDTSMRNLDPPISKDSSSGRIDLENRNVSVLAYIFAVKKEDDRDFHIIVGDESCSSASCFLNVELSGWPKETDHPDRPRLKAVRETFLDFFGEEEPGTSGYDKFDPPIPVLLTGSLFFDVDHTAGSVGPQCCRPSTAWEIHPITDITFEPTP